LGGKRNYTVVAHGLMSARCPTSRVGGGGGVFKDLQQAGTLLSRGRNFTRKRPPERNSL